MPFFSIIIPTYNSSPTIQSCIESILSQTFTDYEILVQDGKSTDDTLDKIAAISESRIKVVSAKDAGIYNAMNKATDRAGGVWYFFLGSDDAFFDNNVLLNIKLAIEKNAQTRFIYGDVFTSEGFMQRYNDYTMQKLIGINICHQAIFYHASLFKTCSYDQKYALMADWDLNLKLFKTVNQPLYIPMPVVVYNLSGKSNNWFELPEYVQYFSNKRWMMVKYGGMQYVIKHYVGALANRLNPKFRQ